MKSFVLTLLLVASASAIRTAPVSAIPQAAIDRAYTQKQLIQNGTNVTNETKVAAIQAKANTSAKATTADFKNPLLGNSEPKPKEVDTSKDVVAWKPETLPPCPSPERTVMDDGKTHVVKYPYVGATCKASLAQATPVPAWKNLEHCPDFNERRTLKDGKTEAVPYPKKGFNCNNEGPI